MKYIRTKDGRIIKIGDYTDVGYDKGLFEIHNKTKVNNTLDPMEILKEADSIEELCDEFVLKATFDGNSEYQISKNLYLLKVSKIAYDCERKYLTEIYGAIWTDKGLIYVAKMNDKGDLEII